MGRRGILEIGGGCGGWDISIYAIDGKNRLRSELTSRPGPPIPPHIWTSTHVVPYTILQLPAYVRTAYGAIPLYSTHGFTRSGSTRTTAAKTIAIRSNPITSCPNSDTMSGGAGLRFCFCMLLFYFILWVNQNWAPV